MSNWLCARGGDGGSEKCLGLIYGPQEGSVRGAKFVIKSTLDSHQQAVHIAKNATLHYIWDDSITDITFLILRLECGVESSRRKTDSVYRRSEMNLPPREEAFSKIKESESKEEWLNENESKNLPILNMIWHVFSSARAILWKTLLRNQIICQAGWSIFGHFLRSTSKEGRL